ncbi:MAG TPA: metalloregulator ArsR/SmtB family transcription factor [Coriobacteriia bacterium]
MDADAVERAVAAVPSGASLETLEGIFAALSDRTRLRILAALTVERLCVCDLAEVAGVSQSAVSHQLRVLRDLRLVGFERDGKRAVYRLADEHVRMLLSQGLEHAAERGGEL